MFGIVSVAGHRPDTIVPVEGLWVVEFERGGLAG